MVRSWSPPFISSTAGLLPRLRWSLSSVGLCAGLPAVPTRGDAWRLALGDGQHDVRAGDQTDRPLDGVVDLGLDEHADGMGVRAVRALRAKEPSWRGMSTGS